MFLSFSILIMIVAAPTLANFAVNLGSVEFFAMTFSLSEAPM